MKRCDWGSHPSMIRYHDKQWGVPVHSDRMLFEMLTLEGAQAGLSWRTILMRRPGYKRLFHNFDVKKVSRMTVADVRRLMKDEGIIRNRGKIDRVLGFHAQHCGIYRSLYPQNEITTELELVDR